MRGKGFELTYPGKVPAERVISDTPRAVLRCLRAFGEGDNRAPSPNMLILGDNLPVLKTLLDLKASGKLKNSDGSPGVRLVYIDPPFSTKLTFKAKNNQKAYEDRLTGADFLEFLRKRVILLKELLSEDGSIYVHMDWKMAHYVKASLDEVFGEENFLNEIVWHYGGRGAKHIARQFPRNHDTILLYRKSSHIFNKVYSEKRVPKGAGGFMMDPSGRWYKTSPRGDYTDLSVEALSKKGRIHRTKNGNIRVKYFLREEGDCLVEDKHVGDVWDDIPDAMHLSSIEKTGYPTQKPEALLYRIISASSGQGDLVLDAFAGSGTALAAAEKLGRNWIGIDSGRLAFHTAEKRLLGIERSRDPVDPKNAYSKRARGFTVYSAYADGPGKKKIPAKITFRLDRKRDRLYLRFSGGVEALSSVMVGAETRGGVLRIKHYFDGEAIKKNGREVRLPVDDPEASPSIIISDIDGNEIRAESNES